MAQAFGIFGFFISLLGFFFASEVMRRSMARATKLEMDLLKANRRILDLENKVLAIERTMVDLHHQKKRQAETLTSLANKGGVDEKSRTENKRQPRIGDANGRFTPSQNRDLGTG